MSILCEGKPCYVLHLVPFGPVISAYRALRHARLSGVPAPNKQHRHSPTGKFPREQNPSLWWLWQGQGCSAPADDRRRERVQIEVCSSDQSTGIVTVPEKIKC